MKKVILNKCFGGFVINYHNIISKYVRMKNGKLQEHFDRVTNYEWLDSNRDLSRKILL